ELRHLRDLSLSEVIKTQSSWCSATRIQSLQLLCLGPVNEHESVAAYAGHHRFGYIEHRGHRNRCIDCIAAAFENLKTDLRGERLAAGNHCVLAPHNGSTGLDYERSAFVLGQGLNVSH